MEKTVSVKTDSDNVKIAVITAQNKIITDGADEPKDETNLELDAEINTQQKSLA
jgi:hypothetical protein